MPPIHPANAWHVVVPLYAHPHTPRLYHQAEEMCRHYPRPLLLIEFDPDRSFGLQSPSELSGGLGAEGPCRGDWRAHGRWLPVLLVCR